MSKIIYKAGCWDSDEFYIGKTKRRFHDRKTEHFKALSKSDHTSAIADRMKNTGHNSVRQNGFSLQNKGDFADSRTTTIFKC